MIMAEALQCDFCEGFYGMNEPGVSLKEFDCWANNCWVRKDWLAKVTLTSNGPNPFVYHFDICPKCSKKLAKIFKTLGKEE
jgi:hypothetical protein